MAHQIDRFCIPQLADTKCREVADNGGSALVLPEIRGYSA
jgi:hypothetical protein